MELLSLLNKISCFKWIILIDLCLLREQETSIEGWFYNTQIFEKIDKLLTATFTHLFNDLMYNCSVDDTKANVPRLNILNMAFKSWTV